MSRVEVRSYEDGRKRLLFWCAPCDTHHAFVVEGPSEPVWTWNGSVDTPTCEPSLRVSYGDGRMCHLFLRNGKVEYLSDCTHELAGQTVDVEPPA